MNQLQPQTLNTTDHPYHLVQDTKQVHLSTKSGAGTILNGEFKSSVAFSVPNLIHAEDDIEYILFSIPYAVIPNSYYIIKRLFVELIFVRKLCLFEWRWPFQPW